MQKKFQVHIILTRNNLFSPPILSHIIIKTLIFSDLHFITSGALASSPPINFIFTPRQPGGFFGRFGDGSFSVAGGDK